MTERERENQSFTPEREETIDLKKLFEKLVEHWKWFVVAIPAGAVLAWCYCMLQEPVYDVVSKVMVNDSKKGDIGTNLVMQELGFVQGDMFVENEMIELQSKNLIREVVQTMSLNIRYFRNGFLRDQEMYGNSPVRLRVNFPELIADTCVHLIRDSEEKIILQDPDGNEIGKYGFSEEIPFDDYSFTIEKNAGGDWDEIIVFLNSDYTATRYFAKNLSVASIEKNTNAIRVAIKDNLPERGKAFIRTLIDCYNTNGIKDKQLVSGKTVEFINSRLDVINGELGNIEDDAEDFKRKNKLTDIASDAAYEMERKKMAGSELLKLQMELDVVKGIHSLLDKTPENEFNLLPENLGITDEGLNSGISRYNEMLLKRNKLLLSANENNPIVQGLDVQLRELKESVRAAVVQVERGLNIKIESVERENRLVDERLISVPTQEKEYRAIARQQELKEKLFLFLMQKREETEIAKLMYIAKAKIIEDPDAGVGPVAPKKALILLLGLILGGAIPVGIVLGKDMFDSKIRGVEDVESSVTIPVLGTFPALKEGETAVGNDDFVQLESMHLVREKLNYFVDRDSCPVIMVTSTIPSEGKSLIASRLAYAYAGSGKKVLLVGCDLRNPSLHNYLKCFTSKGLSSYLAGMENDVDKLIVHVEEGLDVLVGGVVPPNPVQLLSGMRMKELLEALKKRYECIILDTPPVGLLAEGFALSKLADACVYVIRADVSRKDSLSFLAGLKREGRLPETGIVVNGISLHKRRYGYGYGYGYGSNYHYASKQKDVKTSK